jgi:hypothetical protein
MINISIKELIPVLQIAIGPVVLISGVGLIILSLTNRLGRVIDRGRSLARESQLTQANARQIQILSERADLLQRAIFFAVICVLLAAVLIITLFITAAFKFEDAWLVGLLFVGAMGSLIVSLVSFMQELHQSLIAFHIDIGKISDKPI